MKKNVLALSIAAMVGGLGFAGAASAQLAPATELRTAESGTGHILLVPYFNAQNKNMSVFHVVNTDTSNGKAVKVRFRGAANSDDILDFQVFLSPGDVWTAAVSANADGISQLVTYDNSCTLPRIAKGVPVPFITSRLNGKMTQLDIANNTREGYVEMFNMADIKADSVLFKAIKHVNGVAPCTETVLDNTLTTGKQTAGLANPTTGLTGSWYIINVPETTTYSGAANVIRAVDSLGNPAAGVNVFSAQDASAPINLAGSTADPLLRSGLVAAASYDLPDLSTPYLASTGTPEAQVDALAEALSATSVINQFANDAAITAKTDWVISMPTRRYSIAANYNAPVSATKGTIAAAAAAPASVYRVYNEATNTYFSKNAAGNTSVDGQGRICISSVGQVFYDREETGAKKGEAVFSPQTPSKSADLCGEASVLSFNSAIGQVSVLDASVARGNVNTPSENGWSQMNFGGAVPVLGAAFIKVNNRDVGNGKSGTYGITWPHAYVAPVKERPVTPSAAMAR